MVICEVIDEDDDFVAPEEPMSIGELLGACNSQLTNINNASREAEAEETARITTSVMEKAVELSIPLIVETGIAENWTDAH